MVSQELSDYSLKNKPYFDPHFHHVLMPSDTSGIDSIIESMLNKIDQLTRTRLKEIVQDLDLDNDELQSVHTCLKSHEQFDICEDLIALIMTPIASDYENQIVDSAYQIVISELADRIRAESLLNSDNRCVLFQTGYYYDYNLHTQDTVRFERSNKFQMEFEKTDTTNLNIAWLNTCEYVLQIQ